jgi:hypothetical protein
MVGRLVKMVDVAPGVGTTKREMREHVTCPTCGGHHAVAPAAVGPSTFAPPTHGCRDCGRQWTITAAPWPAGPA